MQIAENFPPSMICVRHERTQAVRISHNGSHREVSSPCRKSISVKDEGQMNIKREILPAVIIPKICSGRGPLAARFARIN